MRIIIKISCARRDAKFFCKAIDQTLSTTLLSFISRMVD